MKTVIVALAIVMQSGFVFAGSGKQTHLVKAKHEDVKVYRQAGTSTEIVESLKITDEVMFVRALNQTWSIVQVNGKVGYVLTSELKSGKGEVSTVAVKK
jgi:hypothetical protein